MTFSPRINRIRRSTRSGGMASFEVTICDFKFFTAPPLYARNAARCQEKRNGLEVAICDLKFEVPKWNLKFFPASFDVA